MERTQKTKTELNGEKMDKCDRIEKRSTYQYRDGTRKVAFSEWWEETVKRKAKWRFKNTRGLKGEFNFVFIIWRNALIILNRLNYSCIYVLLIVFQSNIVPLFQCMNYPTLFPLVYVFTPTLFLNITSLTYV